MSTTAETPAPPQSAWTWDEYRKMWYILSKQGFTYQDGSTILYPDQYENTTAKAQEAAKEKEESSQSSIVEEEPPPAYQAESSSAPIPIQAQTSTRERGIWCTRHVRHGWFNTYPEWLAHVTNNVHYVCNFGGCRLSRHTFQDADDCARHMRLAHYCSFHDKFVADWTQHSQNKTHLSCGVVGCVEDWKRKPNAKHLHRDFRNHLADCHLDSRGDVWSDLSDSDSENQVVGRINLGSYSLDFGRRKG
ncbi:hypothetical protein EJ08DRAFT_682216 [Tothia fuscella]|uniref:Uncharacterized protein n=1 Tax=Tothia fuscella TaxID=1048955 RepID=A0A9P4TV90_9PEZI|nr:hypothetical protein EJ08DRAFT_682216 [Tothia fuscella]